MRFRIALIAPALALAAIPGLAQSAEIRIGYHQYLFGRRPRSTASTRRTRLELALEHLGWQDG